MNDCLPILRRDTAQTRLRAVFLWLGKKLGTTPPGPDEQSGPFFHIQNKAAPTSEKANAEKSPNVSVYNFSENLVEKKEMERNDAITSVQHGPKLPGLELGPNKRRLWPVTTNALLTT